MKNLSIILLLSLISFGCYAQNNIFTTYKPFEDKSKYTGVWEAVSHPSSLKIEFVYKKVEMKKNNILKLVADFAFVTIHYVQNGNKIYRDLPQFQASPAQNGNPQMVNVTDPITKSSLYYVLDVKSENLMHLMVMYTENASGLERKNGSIIPITTIVLKRLKH